MSKENPKPGDVFFNIKAEIGWPLLIVSDGTNPGKLRAMYFCYPVDLAEQVSFRLTTDSGKIDEIQTSTHWKFLFNINGAELEELIKANVAAGKYDEVNQDE